MQAPPERDLRLALLELKTSALERRVAAFWRDAVTFAGLALVVFPLLLHWLLPEPGAAVLLALAALLAALVVGIPAFRRERREQQALAQRRQQLYFSIRPDVFSS